MQTIKIAKAFMKDSRIDKLASLIQFKRKLNPGGDPIEYEASSNLFTGDGPHKAYYAGGRFIVQEDYKPAPEMMIDLSDIKSSFDEVPQKKKKSSSKMLVIDPDDNNKLLDKIVKPTEPAKEALKKVGVDVMDENKKLPAGDDTEKESPGTGEEMVEVKELTDPTKDKDYYLAMSAAELTKLAIGSGFKRKDHGGSSTKDTMADFMVGLGK